jgi:hypothetical protein
LLSAAPFFGLPFAGGAALFILCGAFLANIKPQQLMSGSFPLLTMLLLFTLFSALYFDVGIGISTSKIKNGLFLTANILICFAAASLFFAVTTITEIRKTLAGIELFILRRKGRLGLALALMLGFLPRFFECWENAAMAVKARCCKNKFKTVIVILPLVTEKLMETAAETAEALISRGYE